MILTRVDKLILETQAHWHLDENDDCYFYGEYTARGGCTFSETNQLIHNFKKSLDRKGNPWEWKHKLRAIREAAKMLRDTLANSTDNVTSLKASTLIPIPPSRSKSDPLYDDRIVRMLSLFSVGLDLDIRELITQKETIEASHSAEYRPTPQTLRDNYEVDKNLVDPPPRSVLIFDDVLTTGCHFKATKAVIQEAFPGVACTGIFLARRVFGADHI